MPAQDAVLRELAEVLWEESPGHHGGALSKILVAAGEDGSRVIDYRISSYEPRAHVALHAQAKEQIYHFVEGEGLLTIGDRKLVVRKNSYVFIPPGVPHALHNTGLANLVFLVITAPVVV
jgi:mannose-6-phosphate isomerase-like protein (cupin superfamily)